MRASDIATVTAKEESDVQNLLSTCAAGVLLLPKECTSLPGIHHRRHTRHRRHGKHCGCLQPSKPWFCTHPECHKPEPGLYQEGGAGGGGCFRDPGKLGVKGYC